MDTADFILDRTRLTEQLQARRAKDLTSYPFRLMDDFGVKLSPWARLALSFVTRGGAINRLLEIGLPLAVPFLFKKQMPFFDRIVHRIFSRKS